MRNGLILAAIILVVFTAVAFTVGRSAEAVLGRSQPVAEVTASEPGVLSAVTNQPDTANLPMKLPPGLGNPSNVPQFQSQGTVVPGLPLARAYSPKSTRRAAKNKKHHHKRSAKPQKGPNP